MKFTCTQENLNQALTMVSRAVARSPLLPALECVLLATDSDRLRFTATDLELAIHVWADTEITEAGTALVPARLLSSFVKALPRENVDAKLDDKRQSIGLQCGQHKANIKGYDPEEFPSLPAEVPDTAQAITLNADVLASMILRTAFAAAKDMSRPTLNGVHVELSSSGLRLEATDGYRLSVTEATIHSPGTEFSVIVPARAMSELVRLVGLSDETVQMAISESNNQVVFKMADVMLVSQLIDGNFPNARDIIPKAHATRTTLETMPFQQAVRVASLFASDESGIVNLNTNIESSVTVHAKSVEAGDNRTVVQAEVDGEGIEISFNGNYLSEALAAMGTENVVLETTSATQPGVLHPMGKEDLFTHIIMPMKPS